MKIDLFPLVVLRLVYLSDALKSSDKTFDYRKEVFVALAHVNAQHLGGLHSLLETVHAGSRLRSPN